MEEMKLSDVAIEIIKHFYHEYLTEEQELLIDDILAFNEELKQRYKKHGLCNECKQPNTDSNYLESSWCQSCNSKRFQQNFKNWTSGNHDIDEFIQKTQLKAKSCNKLLEWIEYDRFENLEYLAKGGFGTTYKAIWKDGYIESWDSEKYQWQRKGTRRVALKCLHDSQNINLNFLKK